MISVIVPTLLKIDRFYETIKELSECDEVGEIIIINNTLIEAKFDSPKVRQVFDGKNIYINPSWNKGVEMSKYDKLCIINDDIWFDWKYLKSILPFITEDNGMIGMSSFNYDRPMYPFQINPIYPNEKTTRGHRPTGYACCFFIHKNRWDIIPDDLKLWCGDDWVFYRSSKCNYVIDGLPLKGSVSATLNDKSLEEEFSPIKNNDMETMVGYIKQGLIENYLIGTIWWK